MALDRNDPYSAIPQLEKKIANRFNTVDGVLSKLEGKVKGYDKVTNTLRHSLTENSATIESIKGDVSTLNEIKQTVEENTATIEKIDREYVTSTQVSQTASYVAINTVNNTLSNHFTFSVNGLRIFNNTEEDGYIGVDQSGLEFGGGTYSRIYVRNDGSMSLRTQQASDLDLNGVAINRKDAYVDVGSYDLICDKIKSTTEIHLDAPKVFADNIRSDSYSSSANVYCGASGRLYYATGSSSSRRYKHDIEPLQYDAKKLYDIPVVQFKYNEDRLSSEDERYEVPIAGFIAEDIDEVLPILIDHDEEGKAHAWNPNIMIPMMMKLIQEQHEEIEELKAKVERLEK